MLGPALLFSARHRATGRWRNDKRRLGPHRPSAWNRCRLLPFPSSASAPPPALSPLSTLGLMQYLAPSTQFLLGVFLYKEPFTTADLVGYAFIWAALLLYSLEGIMNTRRSGPNQSRRLSSRRPNRHASSGRFTPPCLTQNSPQVCDAEDVVRKHRREELARADRSMLAALPFGKIAIWKSILTSGCPDSLPRTYLAPQYSGHIQERPGHPSSYPFLVRHVCLLLSSL